ncbi:cytochrome P450 [Schizophyllum amplum]|uniref:Cytochrome P450 n=1 Tax=Schizophyllum amplum TaxID=97359 RepID=A0A550BX87_9AGAR|nr:cytochrome P450 [Auriculariopsis ampla]
MQSLFALAFTLLGYALYRIQKRRRVLEHVPGPGSQHWLLGERSPFARPSTTLKSRTGNFPDLLRSPAAEMEFEWTRQYGGALKFNGAFGEQLLLISDPAAAQYILQTSGYGFIRPRTGKRSRGSSLDAGFSLSKVSWLFCEDQLVIIRVIAGEDHKRHRRIMAPGLSSVEINSFLPVFSAKAARMADKWAELLYDKEVAVCDIPTRFDYKFDALDDATNEMANVYHNLLYAIGRLPDRVVQLWNDSVPNKRRAHTKRCRNVGERVARQLVHDKLAALSVDKGGNDIMSRLVKSNMFVDAKDRLDVHELLAELLTMILSGHETTANTLSWTLLELSLHQDVQTHLRSEIRAFLSTLQGHDKVSASALDTLPYLNAVVKETLRFHAPVYNTARTAARDDVIPLRTPIVNHCGESMHEVPVQRGQRVIISIAAYNRDTEIFGPDADEYNPERWLRSGHVNKQGSIGMYSNLLTFGGGHRGCLGWRFAVLELSAFLLELIDRFEFNMSPDIRIHRGAAAVMLPMVEGELDKGAQLPLSIRYAASTD